MAAVTNTAVAISGLVRKVTFAIPNKDKAMVIFNRVMNKLMNFISNILKVFNVLSFTI